MFLTVLAVFPVKKLTMEKLFTTQLQSNGQTHTYQVFFREEEYHFQSESAPEFTLRRQHDEWLGADNLPADLRSRAIEVLEKYLLRQH